MTHRIDYSNWPVETREERDARVRRDARRAGPSVRATWSQRHAAILARHAQGERESYLGVPLVPDAVPAKGGAVVALVLAICLALIYLATWKWGGK